MGTSRVAAFLGLALAVGSCGGTTEPATPDDSNLPPIPWLLEGPDANSYRLELDPSVRFDGMPMVKVVATASEDRDDGTVTLSLPRYDRPKRDRRYDGRQRFAYKVGGESGWTKSVISHKGYTRKGTETVLIERYAGTRTLEPSADVTLVESTEDLGFEVIDAQLVIIRDVSRRRGIADGGLWVSLNPTFTVIE